MADAIVLSFTQIGFTRIGLLWIGIHLFGLIAAWLVRLPSRRRLEIVVQLGFFTSLLAVAATTVVGHICCLEMWPFSAVTLAVMIVIAIVDLGTADSGAISFES